MSTGIYSVVRITLHNAQFLQVFSDYLAGTDLHILPHHVNLSMFDNPVVSSFYNLIDFLLLFCELPRYRSSTSMVGTIMLESLTTGIAQHQSSCLQRNILRHSVHNLSVHSQNGRERIHSTHRVGDTVNLSSQISLGYTLATFLLSCSMHHITYLASLLQFLDFLRSLHSALSHDSLNQSYGSILIYLQWVQTHQVAQLHLQVISALRGEQDFLSFRLSIIYKSLQFSHRC